MYRLRVLGRVALGAGLLAFGVGAALVLAAALVAGDWYLAREPWIGIGMSALVLGLALIGLIGVGLSLIEPIGGVRWLALPPAAAAAFLWIATYLAPISGACCGQPDRDIRSLLYSQPGWLALLVAATLLILVPLAVASRRARRGR